DDGHILLLGLWWQKFGNKDSSLVSWVVPRAAEVCARECSWLTDRASHGPHYSEAQSLRVSPKQVTVLMVESFRLKDLTNCYDRLMPHLQTILRGAIGKGDIDIDIVGEHGRCPNDVGGRTTITSMILNLRSKRVTYHPAMNSLMLWDNQVPKRVVQMLNRVGFCSSHSFQGRCIFHLSQDAVRVARMIVRDTNTVKLLPYDNFNWMSRAWEASALHGSVQHDQVFAMLVVLHIPDGLLQISAENLASVERFDTQAGTRHRIPEETALKAIVPSRDDQNQFRDLAILHAAHILTEELENFSCFQSLLPQFHDPDAIRPHKSERYYLPTFDQEQGSTRGNMVVLRHYFLEVLNLPKSIFERIMYFILGDRLTTARDRAAQDQRSVDRSVYRVDHLSSFAMTSGLMHVCLNFIINIGKNCWGEGTLDSTALSLLRDLLPNRSDINLRKTDFYAWLRFLDAILRALIITAAMSVFGINDTTVLGALKITATQFTVLCEQIVDTYLIPSPDRLEAKGIKTLGGITVCRNAVLTMHDLMTLREMRHAIKYGHPTRIVRMLKYWTPMFYAGLSYNYANECMELLHNLHHDWPSDTAKVLLSGMLVNTTGKRDGFVETDLDVEHLNGRIKARAHGTNATPASLEKATPAMGHIRHLAENMFRDMGVEEQNQHHSKVQQHKDVQILVAHFSRSKIFNFYES
ncbi:hypothetical protein BJ138DRAFT_1021237, partial [Hygrophoropsis aurantiaca]